MIFWLTPPEPSLAIPIPLLMAAALYILGSGRCAQSWPRQLCFWSGLALFYIVSFTRFDYYSQRVFFIHRFQHTVLHHLAPFLIALSRPGPALAAGMPQAWRNKIRLLIDSQPIRSVVDAFNHPIVAAFAFCGLILFWLLPAVHFYAMLDTGFYRVMNWSMAINGLMFWNLALNNYCLRPAHLSPGSRIMMMLAIIPPQIVIGMLIFASSHELYSVYSICGRTFSGISPLAGQQIGGFILWVPAAMMSVLGVLTVMRREWMHQKFVNSPATA